MAQNDFTQFANSGGANVLTQAQWLLLASIISNGFSAGTAPSNQVNKLLRQLATMSNVNATLIADITGANVIDDGTNATILGNLLSAICVAGYMVDTGAVNAYVLTLSPAPVALYDGMEIRFKTNNPNTSTTPTVTVNGLGPTLLTNAGGAGVILAQIQAGTIQSAFYNLASNRFELQNSGAVPAGTILAYSGGTVPSSYLLCPTVQTLVSTATYPNLFAAIGYNWGGSGGSFGLPYLASGYVPVQGTVGVLSHGAILAHTHVQRTGSSGAGPNTPWNTVNSTPADAIATGSTGGADNLAAGMGTQFIVKY